MDEHAETVLPIYGETFDLAGFGDLGRGPQGCCGGHWTADPLLVKVPLVLAHGMPQVGRPDPDWRAIQQFSAKRADPAFDEERYAWNPDTVDTVAIPAMSRL